MTESMLDGEPGRPRPSGPRRQSADPGEHGVGLFLSRWAAHPLRMGSMVPSSAVLCRRLVECGWPPPGGVVLELGAGTGVVTRSFLAAGLPPERMVAVEVDGKLADHLRTTLHHVTVLQGDARALPDLLPRHLRGRIKSVICGIPLVMLATAEQRRFIDAMQEVAPGRGFLQYQLLADLTLAGAQAPPVGAPRGMDAEELSAGEHLAVHADARRRGSPRIHHAGRRIAGSGDWPAYYPPCWSSCWLRYCDPADASRIAGAAEQRARLPADPARQ